jgi:hypothetical protein
MEEDQIKRAASLLKDLELKRNDLNELQKTDQIILISLYQYQSGNPSNSYEVKYRDDFDFKANIKAQVEAKLIREIRLIENDLKLL